MDVHSSRSTRTFTLRGNDGSKDKALLTMIRKHNAIRKITVVVPGQKQRGVESVARALLAPSDGLSFYVGECQLAALLTPEFLKQRNNAQLTVVSYGADLNANNAFAIYPSGKIILSMDCETYQSLGIEGRVNSQSPRKNPWYIVELEADSIRRGTRIFDRLQWCLGTRVAPVRFLASLTSHGGEEPHPNLVFPAGVEYRRGSSTVDLNLATGTAIPDIALALSTRAKDGVVAPEDPVLVDERISCADVFSYAGHAACGTLPRDGEPAPDPYVSTVDPVGSMRTVIDRGCVGAASVEGLFPPRAVLCAWESALEAVARGSAPWVAIIANGWRDAPSSRGADRWPRDEDAATDAGYVCTAGDVGFAAQAVVGAGESYSL